MKIGIIGAMDVEMAALKELVQDAREEEISGVRFTLGTICKKDVVLAVCGIGKVFAALCAEAMILRYAPDVLINIGVAGTLTDRLTIGDVAVGSAAVCHDMDTTAIGDPVGLISGINLVEIPLSETWSARFEEILQREGIRALRGVIASGDQFVSDRAVKDRIKETFGAIACEMEGQAIAQTAYVNKTPCVILRSISDTADGDAADYEQFKHLAAEHSRRVITAFLSGLGSGDPRLFV